MHQRSGRAAPADCWYPKKNYHVQLRVARLASHCLCTVYSTLFPSDVRCIHARACIVIRPCHARIGLHFTRLDSPVPLGSARHVCLTTSTCLPTQLLLFCRERPPTTWGSIEATWQFSTSRQRYDFKCYPGRCLSSRTSWHQDVEFGHQQPFALLGTVAAHTPLCVPTTTKELWARPKPVHRDRPTTVTAACPPNGIKP